MCFMRHVRSRRAHLFSLLFVFWIGFSFAASAQPELSPVTLQLKWKHQFQFAGYYAAVEQGYYRDAGLEVNFKEADVETDIVAEVVSGKADFGVGTSELMISYAQGEPVLMLAPIFQHSPLMMLVRADAGIDSVHDLPGKKVMIEPQSAQLLAYFLSEGIALNRLQYRTHNFGIKDLMTGRIDGLSGYVSDEPFLMDAAKIPYRMFTPRTSGMDFYGDMLFTSQAYFKQSPDKVKSFRKASLKGWQYALSHQEEIIQLIRKRYSTRKSEAHLRYEAPHTFGMIRPDFVELGYSNPGRWLRIQEVYQKYNLMPKKVSFDAFFYTEQEGLKLPQWAYFLLIFLGGLAGLLSFVLLASSYFNRKLRNEVQEREKVEKVLIASRNELEQANQAKRNFLAHMSHEIRTPMNGLVSMLALLKQAPLPAKETKYVNIAHTSASLLLNLVGDILDFSRIEAGKLDLEKDVFCLSTLVKDILSVLAIQAHGKGLSIHAFLPLFPSHLLVGDSTRLQQILFNLLGNAIKFTQSGDICLEIRIESTLVQSSEIVFQIKDTGVGIAEERIAELFEPFQQQDASISRRFGGSGLGLAIASQLVALMEGEIWAESRPEGGSTFGFKLSLPWAEEGHQIPELVTYGALSTKKIGLYGLDSLTHQVIETLLVSTGAKVTVFTQFSDLVNVLKQEELDWGVILLQTMLSHPFPTVEPEHLKRCLLLVPLGQEPAAQPYEEAGYPLCSYPVVGEDLLACFAPGPTQADLPAPASSPQAFAPEQRLQTLLLVEDNLINQVVAQAIIEKIASPFVLKIANHGQEALEMMAADSGEVSLILMDLQMPVMDGFETLKRIRSHEGWSKTPIIAVTAQALQGDRDECLAAGFNDYLSKPFVPEQLQDLLKKYEV